PHLPSPQAPNTRHKTVHRSIRQIRTVHGLSPWGCRSTGGAGFRAGMGWSMAGLQSRGVTASQHETAARIARELVLLLQEARANDCQFLAYLIGMALGESRRLSRET